MQTTSVERLQQTQQQQSDLQQRYAAVHTSEEKKHLKEKVKESDETEKVWIQREEERERKRKTARDHQKAEHKQQLMPEEDEPPEEGMGGRINIRV
jgi:hypothetical protein